MKKLSLLLIIVLTTISCDKLTEVDFDTSLSATSDNVTVNSVASKAVVAGYFETTFVLDLDNADTHDYLDNIKNLDLNEVAISFQGLSALAGNTTQTNLTLIFNNQVTLQFSDFVYADVANGEKYLIKDAQKVSEIAQLLLDSKQLTLTVQGSIPDSAIYNFYIKLTAEATITANVL